MSRAGSGRTNKREGEQTGEQVERAGADGRAGQQAGERAGGWAGGYGRCIRVAAGIYAHYSPILLWATLGYSWLMLVTRGYNWICVGIGGYRPLHGMGPLHYIYPYPYIAGIWVDIVSILTGAASPATCPSLTSLAFHSTRSTSLVPRRTLTTSPTTS